MRSNRGWAGRLPTCFVIQPFDRGPYDKRYDDVFVPAITAADLEPYRVDRDPAAMVPIEEIERRIRSADACLADITEDNPNVWFELGFAIAAGKPVVMVSREKPGHHFPFDIQHRSIITYKTDSASDFQALQARIIERLRAALTKERRLEQLVESSVVANVGGLKNLEIVALATLAANAEGVSSPVPSHQIRQDMEKQGFTKVAVTVALAALMKRAMIEMTEWQDEYEHLRGDCSLADAGAQWLIENQGQLVLKGSDDIPF